MRRANTGFLKHPIHYIVLKEWEGLNSIGMVQRISAIGSKQTTDTRYFISLTEINAKLFGNAVRSHWGN